MENLKHRLIAIDPSLTCSGWALFEIGHGRLLGVGKIRSLSSALPLADRLTDLQAKIRGLFEQTSLCLNDVLVCEAATTMRDPKAAMKVEQVRGIFEVVARERGLEVPGRLNPRSVHSEVMGLKGKQLPRALIKSAAVDVVGRLFGRELNTIGFGSDLLSLQKHQDVVDALLIGYLALSRIRSASVAGVSLSDVFVERITGRGLRVKRRVLEAKVI